jgi:hypothetical protein
MNMLDPGDKPAEADLFCTDELYDELKAFARTVMKGEA